MEKLLGHLCEINTSLPRRLSGSPFAQFEYEILDMESSQTEKNPASDRVIPNQIQNLSGWKFW
jgi:hypothetical protein